MAGRAQKVPQRVRLLRVDPGIGWRIRRFLGSPGHVVGALFGIAGIIMLNLGLISGPLAAVVIVGMYAIGYFLASRPRITQEFGVAPAEDADKIEVGLDQMLATIRRRVSADIYQVVLSTRDAIVFTLDHAADMQTDPDIYAVRQTAMTYLPEALSKYIALPRVYAERQIIENGKTSHDILLDQLRLMETKVHEVADAMIERDSQRLVTHGRFIADRFSDSSFEAQPDSKVAMPTAAPAAAPVAQSELEAKRERVKVV
jgi:hypothetical protein